MKIDLPEYTKEEFEDLLYPFFSIPIDKSILKELKSEMDFSEFHAKLDDYGFNGWKDRNKVYRYIACAYDISSPFHKDFKDANKRKYASALFVGFETDENGRFDIEVEQMILCMVEPITNMIVRYIRNHHDHDWSYLKVVEDKYYQAIVSAYKPDSEVSFKDLKSMKDDIHETEKIILARDKNRRLEDVLYEHIDKDRLEFRPEDIARKARNKKEDAQLP